MRRALICTAAALTALIPVGAYIFFPADPISQATCDRIKEGFTESQVIQLVGRKWDELTDSCWSTGTVGRWHGNNGSIDVVFVAPNGQELRVYRAEYVPSTLSWWERIRKHLGW